MDSSAGASVVRIDPGADPRWDGYVEGRDDARMYHYGAWSEILRRSYGFRPMYLAAVGASDELVGVFPLMLTVGAVTRRRLRSLPVAPIGGPLADSPEALAALVRAACDLAGDERAKRLMINSPTDLDGTDDRLERVACHPTWVTALPDDPASLRAAWKKSSKNLHRSLQKAERGPIVVRESTAERDLRAFYRLYLETMRRHRSLPLSLKVLRESRRVLAPRGQFRIFVAEIDGRAVAAGVFHTFGDTIELVLNASADDALDLRPNFALYWHAIQWAIERGYRRYDWGQAPPDNGLGRFKRQWSAEPLAEHCHVYVVDRGARDPAGAMRDASAQMEDSPESLASKAWGRAPLRATQVAGGVLRRWL